ncbi:MAG: hypothetical protein HOQ12_08420 [Gemmatimonadaceae bacterium]|nr:hypothetical protein [Gemmatimonadaceae bacterium]NUR19541.1 hypothetical protein [Gemmatimonadaceae bacterium]
MADSAPDRKPVMLERLPRGVLTRIARKSKNPATGKPYSVQHIREAVFNARPVSKQLRRVIDRELARAS